MAEDLRYVRASAHRGHLVLCNVHILSHSAINFIEKDKWMNKQTRHYKWRFHRKKIK